jgi:hypothetical protein
MARGKRRHDADDRDYARKNRIEKIRREAPKLIAAATGKDAEWLEQSMLALDMWFNAMTMGNMFVLRGAIEVLERLGWSEPLRRLFPTPLGKFPTQINRENTTRNREFFAGIRECRYMPGKRPFLTQGRWCAVA